MTLKKTKGLEVRIGTSGIVVPGNKLTFPKEFQTGTRLQYYSSLFNTLEINSSFYKIPLPTTFAKWATEVPHDFKFTVKLWRGITHAKKLIYMLDDVDTFIAAANHLENKKGCLLIQFPASITSVYQEAVEKILQRLDSLQDTNPWPWQLAIEFRNASWYTDDTYKILERYKSSLVFHDMAASKTPLSYKPTQAYYFRFHGPSGNYRDSYSNEFIRQYAERIKAILQREKNKEVYVYFNNTMGGALENAQLLHALV